MLSAERLSEMFVEVADTLVAGFDLVEFLQNLTEHAADVCGTDAAGLLLADQHDRLHYMASSSERGKLLELYQLQKEEGPCLDCFRTGEPVINSDLGQAETRWPEFAPRAVAAGFESVHAVPMRIREQVIGALNLFGTNDVRFEPAEVRIVQAMAHVATIALLQERHIARAETLTEQLQGALNSRIVVEQAKGAIAGSYGIGVDEAFTLIRAHARRHQQPLTYVCNTVLTNPDTIAALDADVTDARS